MEAGERRGQGRPGIPARGPATFLIAAVLALAMPGASRAVEAAPRAAWEWGPSLLLYVLPGQSSYLQPTLTVDRGWLHLEARYNYEARETGSAWLGVNLSFGEDLRLGLVPMAGGVFGATNGIAAGLTLTLDWGPLSLWHQSEWVVDLGGAAGSFYYLWSELSVTGPDWLRAGLVLQRTRAFQTSTAVQGGPLLGVSAWKLSATVYLFAPGQDDQFVVVAASGTF